MAEETLEEYQKKAFKTNRAKFTFTAKCGKVEETKPSKPLQTHNAKFLIYFTRYILLPPNTIKDTNTSYKYDPNLEKSDGSLDTFNPKGAPRIDKHAYYLSILEDGYIYLYDQDKGKWQEFFTDVTGIAPIIWKKDKSGKFPDIRPISEKDKQLFYPVKEDEKHLWACFSKIQWSADYAEKVFKDEELRKKRMQKITTKSWKGENPSLEDALTVKDVSASFMPENNKNDTVSLQKCVFDSNIQALSIDADGNEYGNMVFALHDPVSCASDLNTNLATSILELKALTEAIQTGETLDNALDRLQKGGKQAKNVNVEHQELYTLALACYKMVYNSKESTKKYDGGKVGWNMGDTHFPHQEKPKAYKTSRGTRYKYPPGYERNEFIGSGLHREKVENILGVSHRNEQRKVVNTLREYYGTFIKSSYYQDILVDYIDNAPENSISGLNILVKELLLLLNNPYNIDRHLLLDKDYKNTDSWIDWLVNIFLKDSPDPNSNFEKVLLNEISLSDVILDQWIDISNKFGATLYTLIEIYGTIAYKTKIVGKGANKSYQRIVQDGQEYILKKLNKITITTKSNNEVVKLFHFGNSSNIEFNAAALGVAYDPNLEVLIEGPEMSPKVIIADGIEHQRIYGQKATKAGGGHRIKSGDKVENISKSDYNINAGNTKRYNERAAKFLNSRGFSGVLTGLQVINFGSALMNISVDEDNISQSAKSIINAGGIAAELTEASLRLRTAHFNFIGKEVTKRALALTTIAGALGGAVTSAMCLWDSALTFKKRDADASAAWFGAGVAFGVSTAAAVWGSSVAILAGPVGWIALGIGLGLVILANFFTDTELEFYFKNFLLSDEKALPIKSGELPMSYSKRLLTKKLYLMDTSDKEILNTLMNPSDAMASLYDLTICNSIQYSVPSDGFSKKIGHGHNAYYYAYKFDVSIHFNQFLQYPEQLEAIGIILNGGEQNLSQVIPLLKKVTVKKLDNGQKLLIARLFIPDEFKKLVDFNSKLIIALRLRIDDKYDNFFPYPTKKDPVRYMGAKFGLRRHHRSKASEGTQELVFSGLAKLENESAWD